MFERFLICGYKIYCFQNAMQADTVVTMRKGIEWKEDYNAARDL